MADALLAGQSLLPGEFLISDDGRFRLVFEPTGTLSLYAYTTHLGRYVLWGVDGKGDFLPSPPNRFTLPPQGPAFWSYPDREDAPVIFPNFSGVPNHQLVVQSDGNLVLTGVLNGNLVVLKATNVIAQQVFGGQRSVVPNERTCEVAVGGRLAIGNEVTDGDIFVRKIDRLGVTDGITYSTVLRDNSIAVVQAQGVLRIETPQYNFATLSGPEPDAGSVQRDLRNSDDGLPAVIEIVKHPGTRFTLDVGPGGELLLTHPIPGLAPTHHTPIRVSELVSRRR